jgi:hypothetical protein
VPPQLILIKKGVIFYWLIFLFVNQQPGLFFYQFLILKKTSKIKEQQTIQTTFDMLCGI